MMMKKPSAAVNMPETNEQATPSTVLEVIELSDDDCDSGTPSVKKPPVAQPEEASRSFDAVCAAAQYSSSPFVPTPSVKPTALLAPSSRAKPAAPALTVGECPPDYHDLYDQW